MSTKTLNMKKTIFVSITYVIIYFLCITFITDQFLKNLLGNLLSPLGAFFSAYLIFFNYRHENLLKLHWFFLFLGAVVYGTGDLFWFFYESVLNTSVSNIHFINYIYILANVLLCISVFYKIYKLRNYWQMLQFFFDSLILVSILGFLTWKLLIEPSIISIEKMDFELITNYLYLLTDFLIISGISIFYVTYKSLIYKKHFMLSALGLILYTSGDIISLYQNIHGKYVSNSIFDLSWIIGLILVGISSLYESKYDVKCYSKLKKSSYKPYFSKMTYPFAALILYIAIIYFFHNTLKEAAIISVLFILLILSRQIAAKLITLLNENNNLVNELKELNDSLETIVFKRTEELLEKNTKLDYLSNHDPLTGIANRRYYMNELERLMNLNKNSTQKIVLIFIDLDHFKMVNDFLGHDMGDKLLIEVVERIKKCINPCDILGRQGGDEFIIILNNIKSKEQIFNIVYSIRDQFKSPIILNNHNFTVTMSIGISIYPDNALDANSLMKAADTAMYCVKDRGKNNFEFYNIQMQKDVARKVIIENELRYALSRKEFNLYYQPQFSLYNNELIGMEALLRWQNNKLGNISPSEFIPIAENNGLIIPISEWIIAEAVKQIKFWNRSYNINLKIGINISPNHFAMKDFVSTIRSVVDQNEIKPSYLDLEITEGIALQNIADTVGKLEQLRSLGIRISIDDFGTGYSSLSYLNKLSIDTLKIDKSFILDIHENEDNYRIATAIIALAKSLNIHVLAEGIELEEQKEILKNLGCEQGQGYLLGKPLSANEFEVKFLKLKEITLNI